LDKNKKKKYNSESIKFKNDIDNFIYDFKIYGDTGALIKFVSIGFHQEKEYEYIKLNKSEQFKLFLNY